MNLKIVKFKAFDKECIEPFLDKDMKYIHDKLFNMCFTYVLKEVLEIDLNTVTLEKVEYEKLERMDNI